MKIRLLSGMVLFIFLYFTFMQVRRISYTAPEEKVQIFTESSVIFIGKISFNRSNKPDLSCMHDLLLESSAVVAKLDGQIDTAGTDTLLLNNIGYAQTINNRTMEYLKKAGVKYFGGEVVEHIILPQRTIALVETSAVSSSTEKLIENEKAEGNYVFRGDIIKGTATKLTFRNSFDEPVIEELAIPLCDRVDL
ncbi:MAG: hypothetical protein AAB590_03860 [Patescibacteria group bacterium]